MDKQQQEQQEQQQEQQQQLQQEQQQLQQQQLQQNNNNPLKTEKNIITHLPNVEAFYHILHHNPGLVIIKFTADWCAPCKRIKPAVDAFFCKSPSNVICMSLKIEENVEVYMYMKRKRMLSGVPSLLMYKKGNKSYVCDESVVGSELSELKRFMTVCGRLSSAF